MKVRVAAILVAGAVVAIGAQERIDHDTYWKIRQEATTHSQILKTVQVLTDLYGPRPTGSPNLKAAGEWAVKQMESWGLQNGRLEPWDWGNPGWLNERLSAHIISPVKDHLVAEALAWTPGTNGPVKAAAVQITLPVRPTKEAARRASGCVEEHREGKDRPGGRAPARAGHVQRSARTPRRPRSAADSLGASARPHGARPCSRDAAPRNHRSRLDLKY